MAEKRERAQQQEALPETNSQTVAETAPANTGSAEERPTDNSFEAVLKRLDEQEKRIREQDRRAEEQDGLIRNLKKEIAAATWDTSEDVKESKRKYGYELDGVTRRSDEQFEYGFRTLVHDRKEKAVISTETIGRPVTTTNFNKGTRAYVHDIKVKFHDGTETEMDAIEFINQFVTVKKLVPDSDIRKDKDGTKFYTFRTEEFGTFEVSQKFIN